MKDKKLERTILIEKYLDGELQGDDLKNFELQLQADKDFANDCSLHKAIRESFEGEDVIDLRKKLDRIRKDFKKTKKS